MSYDYMIEVDRHLPTGPISADEGVYGHSLVVMVGPSYERDDNTGQLAVCLDCGFVHYDMRAFAHEDCERGDNPVNTTLREALLDE